MDLTQGKVVSFTGSRGELDRRQAAAIRRDVEHLAWATGFVTGGCIGIDAFLGELLFARYPSKTHLVVVPADRSRVAAWWRRYDSAPGSLTVHEMPAGSSYMHRNQAMVSNSAALVGYPAYDERVTLSKRSGSWQTIRMARRQHERRPIVHVLDQIQQIQPDAWGWV